MSKVKEFVVATIYRFIYYSVYGIAFIIGYIKGIVGATRAIFNDELEAYLSNLISEK